VEEVASLLFFELLVVEVANLEEVEYYHQLVL
jgi:hypothetical protein